ncbi:MAG: HAD family phosphatase, partial [Kiritimatiellae bacterium]|nr:HAD family phosphatase [Kiritimatiellia bacterium]
MLIEAVLFDHDGTLVDSEPTHWNLWKAILPKYGVEVSEDEYRQCYLGIPASREAELIVQKHSLPVQPGDLAKEKEVVLRDFLATRSFPLMPHVFETLTFFKNRNLKLGVVTGAARTDVKHTLKTYGLSHFFDVIASADDVVNSKPAPDVYLYATGVLGIPPEKCLAIEDTANGVRSAVSAGLTCLAVINEYSIHEDF